MEAAAEAQRLAERRRRATTEDAERSGETLLDLVIEDHDSGLGGRFLLTLVKRNRNLGLPWNRLRVGAPVILSEWEDQACDAIPAIVSGRSVRSIQIACTEFPSGDRFRLDLSPDEVTRRRMKAALAETLTARGRLGELRRVMFGERPPRWSAWPDIEWQSPLNSSQQEAIRFALAAQDVAVIHGPPGTGKTTTVAELVFQAVRRGEKILACAPSNTAVDNLLDKLLGLGVQAVRLGHPARVARGLREHSLDLLVENHEHMPIVRQLMREAEQLLRKSSKWTRGKPERGARQEQRREASQLRKEARALEQQAVDHILDKADVICATTTLDEDLLGPRRFDLLVVDEACQSTEPGCWIPLRFADRVILAGDHCQLPPTVLSTEAAAAGFARSLLERLLELYGPQVQRRLQVQYRMHEQIMQFSSQRFYDNSLVASEAVRTHRLCDLPGVQTTTLTREPVLFIDTAGSGWEEQLEPDGESRLNPQEARLVLHKVAELEAAGVATSELAIIAPYAGQVRLLRELAQRDSLEIDTVDGFQGREKEAVIISLVRSNQTGEIGFLADTRRMNVALTRARRKLIVIGDSATIGGHPFYASLLQYFEAIDAYHTVWEEEVAG